MPIDADIAAKKIAKEAARIAGLQIVEPTESSEWPRAMEPEAFAGLAGDFVRLIEPETEADRVALLGNFLVAAGVLFGRDAYAQADGRTHFPVEYIMTVGPTGTGRKGTATGRVLATMEATEDGFRSRVLGGLSSGEGLIKAVSAQQESPDSTRRFLVLLSEFASLLGVMKREGNTMSAILREAWDGTRLQVLTRKDPLSVENVNLSVIAHITPSELLNGLTATDRANGFANRFLVVCVRRSKFLPEGGARVNTGEIVRRLHRALESAKSRGLVERNEAARALWADVYEELTGERDGLKGALCGRAEAHVLRLSLLYALLDSSTTIRVEHLRAALAFWKYCERSVDYLFADQSGDPEGDKILRAVASGPKTLSELHRVFGNNRTAEWLNAKLGALVRSSKLTPTSVKTERHGEVLAWGPK